MRSEQQEPHVDGTLEEAVDRALDDVEERLQRLPTFRPDDIENPPEDLEGGLQQPRYEPQRSARPTVRNGRHAQRRDAFRVHARPGDLPDLVVPSGYLRDGRGTWRRSADRSVVPGARDITLGNLWGEYVPPRGPVRLPEALLPRGELVRGGSTVVRGQRSTPELAWVRGVADIVVQGGMYLAVVPREEWDDRAVWPLGMDAPEVSAQRLVGVPEVAAMFGIAEPTVAVWLSRGKLPSPTFVFGRAPRWSVPVLLLETDVLTRDV